MDKINCFIKRHKYIIYLMLLAAFAAVFYWHTSAGEAAKSGPAEDAGVYVFMAKEFASDRFTDAPVSSLYGQRIFMPFLAGTLMKVTIKDYKAKMQPIISVNSAMKEEARPFITELARIWHVTDSCFFALALIMLFLIMRHYKIPDFNAVLILTLAVTWATVFRLYFYWVFMSDVAAFSLIITAMYFLLKRKYYYYAGFAALAFLTKEQTLQIIFLTAPFILLSKDYSVKKRIWLCLGIITAPLLPYIILRFYPIFNEMHYAPNGIARPDMPFNSLQKFIINITGYGNNFYMHLDQGSNALMTQERSLFNTYIIILVHNFVLKVTPVFPLAVLMTPFSAFAGLMQFIVLKYKEALNFLKEHKYWLIYGLSFLPFIISDRYLTLLSPLVIILGGICSKTVNQKTLLLVMAPTIFLSALQWRCFSFSVMGFEKIVLLEYLNPSSAFRVLVYAAIIFAVQYFILKTYKNNLKIN